MEINILKKRLVNSKINISRELLAYSSISSIPYIKRMKVQNNNLSQANQVDKLNEFQELYLFYTNLRIGKDNTYNKITDYINITISHSYTNILNFYGEETTNCSIHTYIFQEFESIFILYTKN